MLYSTYSRWEYTLVRVYFSELWSFTCQSPHLCAHCTDESEIDGSMVETESYTQFFALYITYGDRWSRFESLSVM